MDEPIKMLRYNTGNDKQAFIKFKDNFDAVIFNAAIVAHSGSAVSDLVSMHKRKYIIDPQTHIFQHDIKAILSKDKLSIKQSVQKYLNELPKPISNILGVTKRPLSAEDISVHASELVDSVYDFETKFVNSFIKQKEYDKYLQFAHIGPVPLLVISPYFMLKTDYSDSEMQQWLDVNKKCLHLFIQKNNGAHRVSAQLVMDKEVLTRAGQIEQIRDAFCVQGCDYVFLWINDFNTMSCSPTEMIAFYNLLKLFSEHGIKPLMAYGGYDSIFLCNSDITYRLYGVAQSVGYGEAREITPVGGGMPTNKYYFLPLHKRLKFNEAAAILIENGYFDNTVSPITRAHSYYSNICKCPQCQQVIKDDINNFSDYNDSTPFTINSKTGPISRNRPTTNASLIAAMHFLYCKVHEWKSIKGTPLDALVLDLQNSYHKYNPKSLELIRKWCNLYAK